jgi:hypothetical protein
MRTQTFQIRAIGSVHGARLTADLAKKIRCPAMVYPSKDDASYEPIEKVR